MAFFGLPYWAGASTLTSFSFVPYPQGANPTYPMVLASDGNYYGTTATGGKYNYGTVFKLTPSGVRTTLAEFDKVTNSNAPTSGLIQASDGNFYGTTNGGSSFGGTVFKVTPAGTLTTLANVSGGPSGGLIQASDGNLYGTTVNGTDTSFGSAFKVTLGGVVTVLANFSGNSKAGLIQATDGNFYGTSFYAGTPGTNPGYGTVFQLKPNGTFTTLVAFSNSNGAGPSATLIQDSQGNFYGTTAYGGPGSSGSGSGDGKGTFFKLTPNGSGGYVLSTLVNFNGTNGAYPMGVLYRDGAGNIYGTTIGGGVSNYGTVFKLTSAGVLSTVVDFGLLSSGTNPYAGLILGSDGNLYGSTAYGGTSSGAGTLFKMTTGGTLTTLVNFVTSGYLPYASLMQGSDGKFYGTTYQGGKFGGNSGYGTVFQFSPEGGITTLGEFNLTNGNHPYAALVQDGAGNFYGTTLAGGSSDKGTVFQCTPGGTINTLVNFNNPIGTSPYAGLLKDGLGNFYGTTSMWGPSTNFGTVFKMTSGGALTTLANFNLTMNGARPYGPIVLGSDANYYGTTLAGNSTGGSSGFGTIFQLTPGGTLTTLVDFTGTNGATPYAGLVQAADGSFYGTASAGGASNLGTVFRLVGNTLTTLVSFNTTNGATPQSGLLLGSDGNFYGTTNSGGASGKGTLFKITPGGALTTLIHFNDTNGANPYAGASQGADGNYYGTTQYGGTANSGTIFRYQPGTGENITIDSPASVPISASSYVISGSSLNLTLGFTPAPGTVLTLIRNISGTFSNLSNGGTISVVYNGHTFVFQANYAGGSGHDLVLTLISGGFIEATDTPLLPPWALVVMAAAIFLTGCWQKRRV